jgi:outer membrane protein OmpA-like peptidoglycan-associated protein
MKRMTVLGVVAIVACGGESKPSTTPTTTTVTTTPTATTPSDAVRKPVGLHLTVSGDIFRLCHLEAASDAQAAPKFGFDQSLITPADAITLDKIAVCLNTGALAGRHVKLTGRADPRGTEEYNLSLGARRAHGVASYLEENKVQGTQLNETSRGALDATGDDEPAWAADRRVDILLLPQ